MAYRSSQYSERVNSTIRFNILEALQELATTQGITIKEMQTTYPYSIELNGITSQKMTVELRKLIDSGMVVKSNKNVKGNAPMKYMLRSTYNDLNFTEQEDETYGYGDYRDDNLTEEEEEAICERLRAAANRTIYEDMW